MATDEEFDSLDPDSEEFRELGYQAVDMMADHFECKRTREYSNRYFAFSGQWWVSCRMDGLRRRA